MRINFFLFVTASFFTLSLFCQTYITNVTLIDVEKQKLIPDVTVVITGNTISDIGPSKKIKLLTDATIIDGKGKFLLPGLTDAHIHFFQSGGLYTRPDVIDLRKYISYEKEIDWTHNNMEDILRRYTQTGITTVIDVGATINFLQQRDSFKNKNYAPSIYMTGPLLTTWEPEVFKNLQNDEPFNLVKTPEEAKATVQKQLPFRPDFIKIWYIVPHGKNLEDSAKKLLPVVKAIIDEAHKNNLKVAVHATERITAQLAVESKCDYLVHEINNEIVSDEFLFLLKKNNIIVCPTLIVADNYAKTFARENQFSYYDLTKSNSEQLGSLYDLKHLSDTNLVEQLKKRGKLKQIALIKSDSIMRVNLKKMSDAGIAIVSGTDAGNIGTQHATSYFAELLSMQQSGLSNWQIIQSSTINGAKVLGKEKEFGSITTGKRADMILLNANPLDNLNNLQKIFLIINKGFVINPDTLIKETPLSLVQRQLNAYNARNLDAFVEQYADDVELYKFPDTLIGKGKEYMYKTYSSLFDKTPNLHCEIKKRIIQGNIIIDNESVTRNNKIKQSKCIAIYHIENNKIKKVYFIK
ncbi:MAG: amidohydrolase family protein [Bacteroidota bacterium]